jgi:hypothetical protein
MTIINSTDINKTSHPSPQTMEHNNATTYEVGNPVQDRNNNVARSIWK